MVTVTLLEKAYGSFPPEMFEPVFQSLCNGLRVQLKVAGTTRFGWIQVEISGEDEAAALNYLNREVGLTPSSAEKLRKNMVVRGRVVSPRKSKMQLYVDVGVFSPQTLHAAVTLQHLQAQLVDGKKIALQRITELFGIHKYLPLKVRIDDAGLQEGRIKAGLSEAQLSQFAGWVRSRVDRLIILGAPISDVMRAVKASKHVRDIIGVESLGLLEHVVVCKLGTDAVGLIPELGAFLRGASFAPFSPTQVLKLIGEPFL
ncbi:MAG: DUF2110 family protein [Thermoproteota archaeon]|nr:DUF2110 family protein [Thermoproteota archaeon]